MAGVSALSSSGALKPDTGGPMVSGQGAYAPEGIVVGSKVVGSGSASTALPRLNTAAPGGGLSTGNASTGQPAWVIPALVGAAILALVFLFLPGRRRK